MSAPSDPDGDAPIDCESFQFNMVEMAALTLLPPQSIKNWQFREYVPPIGRKDGPNLTSPWRFSILDGLVLQIMVSLSRMDFLLVHAGTIAARAVEAARADLRKPRTGTRQNTNLVAAWSEDGEVLYFGQYESGTVIPYPPKASDEIDYNPLRNTHVIVPVTAMLHDLILRTQRVPAADDNVVEFEQPRETPRSGPQGRVAKDRQRV